MAQRAEISRERAGGLPAWLDPLFLALTMAGIVISTYLTYTHFTDAPIICTPDRSCDVVNRSAYAFFPPNWGIPVSVLGLLGYIALIAAGFYRWQLVRKGSDSAAATRSRLDMALFIMTLVGVVFSAYLTAMELWVIHAVCWWCVGSAVCITGLFIISVVRAWAAE